MNPDQSNTTQGVRPGIAGEDLTGKRSRLLVLTNSGGKPVFTLPTANNAPAIYLCQDEGASGEPISVEAIHGKQVRIPLKGTCNPGDTLVLADVSDVADKGKLRALPAAAGTYRPMFIAEEAGVDGQLVLCRRHSAPDVVVS